MRHRLAGAPVPVAGIAEIALDPVQMRVHPVVRRARPPLLGDPMRLVPLAARGMPQRHERRGEPGRRLGGREAGVEGGKVGHDVSSLTLRWPVVAAFPGRC